MSAIHPRPTVIVSCFKGFSSAFRRISQILAYLEKAAPEHSHLREMANLGCNIANDQSDIADSWQKEFEVTGVSCEGGGNFGGNYDDHPTKLPIATGDI